MSITSTLNGNPSKLVADYFPLTVLESNYVCSLISFDTYHSMPNIDFNLFHSCNHIIEIRVGSCDFPSIYEVSFADVLYVPSI